MYTAKISTAADITDPNPGDFGVWTGVCGVSVFCGYVCSDVATAFSGVDTTVSVVFTTSVAVAFTVSVTVAYTVFVVVGAAVTFTVFVPMCVPFVYDTFVVSFTPDIFVALLFAPKIVPLIDTNNIIDSIVSFIAAFLIFFPPNFCVLIIAEFNDWNLLIIVTLASFYQLINHQSSITFYLNGLFVICFVLHGAQVYKLYCNRDVPM